MKFRSRSRRAENLVTIEGVATVHQHLVIENVRHVGALRAGYLRADSVFVCLQVESFMDLAMRTNHGGWLR